MGEHLEGSVIMPPEVAMGTPMSESEWLALDEDHPGELVAGRLQGEEAPEPIHELAVSFLVRLLGAWLNDKGFVFGSELKVRVAPGTGRKPDIVVFLPGGHVPPKHGAVQQPPDIVFEVVTPTPRDERRDRVEKMHDYGNFGVPWYWIDPALGSLEIFERDSTARYAKAVGMTEGKLETVPGCPGLTIDLDALWADLARLSES